MDIIGEYFSLFRSEYFIATWRYLFDFAPLWAPVFLGMAFVRIWMTYVRTDYILKQGSVLLEIKLPREIRRSPKGMEIFFTSLYQTGAMTEISQYWEGKVRPWFAAEFASFEGEIHLYIWAHQKFKNLVESQLYAHYPGIEIYEAEDYTRGVQLRTAGGDWDMWGMNYKRDKEEPYPMMTYVDYGLDKDDEEEFKTDPLAALLEYLGSLGKGEQVWFQILFQAHKKEKFADGRLWPRPDWKEKIKKEVEKIRKEATPESTDPKVLKFPNPTKGQQELIASLERNESKFPFETLIRSIYLFKPESFNAITIVGLVGSVRQFNSNARNGLKTGLYTDFDYPWQDIFRMRRTRIERNMIQAYKMRSIFHAPYKNFMQKPYVMTTEELATIFHFPGLGVETPTLPRIPSKKAEAPPNLPI